MGVGLGGIHGVFFCFVCFTSILIYAHIEYPPDVRMKKDTVSKSQSSTALSRNSCVKGVILQNTMERAASLFTERHLRMKTLN